MYALNVSDAIKEADNFNRYLQKYRGKLELPIFCDFEYDTERYANQNGVYFNKRLRTDIVKAFCKRLEEYGWYVGNYCNVDYYKNKWYQSELDRFDLWIADWRENPDLEIIKKSGMWQYTEKGRANGVIGNVDISILYKDYPSIIKSNGLNGFNKKHNPNKSNDEVANEVLKGKWGNGIERKQRLENNGYNYKEIQHLVNVKLIAKDVIKGKYGNGETRKTLLQKEGYDYREVQNEVNRMV